MKQQSRRTFLRHSMAGAAAAGLTPNLASTARSQDRVDGANRRIRVALIGCGGMGQNDLRDSLRLGAQVVGLCDVDDDQASKAKAWVSKDFSQSPELITRDFRKILDLKDLDAVIVGTPDHWHALTTLMACEAGKDVYVEKPLSLTIAEGRAMVDVARKTKRVVQMGTQQRARPTLPMRLRT